MPVAIEAKRIGDRAATFASLGNRPLVGNTLQGQAEAIIRKYSASVYLPEPGGYVLGGELVTNGDFSSGTTGWADINIPSPTVSGEVLVVERTVGFVGSERTIACGIGKTYLFTGSTSRSTGTGLPVLRVRTGSNLTGSIVAESIISAPNSALTQYQFTFTATAATLYVQLVVNTSAAVCQFDNISVREILNYTGNLTNSTRDTPAVNDGSVGYVAGQAVGPELVTNGGFDADTGWTKQSGWTISGGVASVNSAVAGSTYIRQGASEIGKAYLITFTITSFTSGTVAAAAGGTIGIGRTTTGTYTDVVIANSTAGLGAFGSSTTTVASIDNISVRELGYIATQSTAGYKPQLVGGARNLLTYSEDFSNAAWAKGGSAGISESSELSPFSRNSELLTITSTSITAAYTRQAFTPVSGVYYTLSCYVKKNTNDWALLQVSDFSANAFGAYFNINSGAVGSSAVVGDGEVLSKSIESAGNGWYRIVMAGRYATGRAAHANITLPNADAATTSTANNTIYVFGCQLEQSSTAGPYVPTTTAPASQGGRPRAWLFDGTDDRLSLSGPLFQMSDDHFVVACAKKTTGSNNAGVIHPAGKNTGQVCAGLSYQAGAPQVTWTDDTLSARIITHGSVILNACVISGVKQADNKRLRVNGAQSGAVNSAAMGATTLVEGKIGALIWNNAESCGTIYCVIAGKGTITDAELLVLERYAASMGGISI